MSKEPPDNGIPRNRQSPNSELQPADDILERHRQCPDGNGQYHGNGPHFPNAPGRIYPTGTTTISTTSSSWPITNYNTLSIATNTLTIATAARRHQRTGDLCGPTEFADTEPTEFTNTDADT